MARLVEAIVRSLSLRLLVPLLAIVTGVLAAYGAVTLYVTRQHFTELVAAEARRSSELVLRALHDRMLEGAQSDVQRTVDALTSGGTVTGIRLYTTAGAVAQSTVASEVGARLERGDGICGSCHGPTGTAATGTRRDLVQAVAGGTRLRHLEVIPNHPSCGGCHAGTDAQAILGVLDLELAMDPLDRALSEARRLILGTLVGLVLFTGLASTLVIQRLVHRPVRQLYEGTRRIARGDLDSRIEVAGRHELSALAESFNQMTHEVKAARQEVTSWSQRLEDKVVAKTDELRQAQRQVLHTERMASLGRLAATVAHELNNPLGGILSCARLVERELAEQPLPPAVRRDLEESLHLIERECSRCGSIVSNLLLFARHSGGTEMAPVDVAQVIDRSLMLVRHRLELASIQLERSDEPYGETGFTITAHAGQLEQALVALLVNAVEAMEPDREGVLAVRLGGDADHVEIAIADTGVGIHPDVLPHIFEPFFSTKDKESGVGLGLAIVYGIVQRHGGTIAVDSTTGQGTSFVLRMPRRQEAVGVDAGREAAAPGREDGVSPGGSEEAS
jgi:two-component system, NtrC family, sensor kinase